MSKVSNENNLQSLKKEDVQKLKMKIFWLKQFLFELLTLIQLVEESKHWNKTIFEDFELDKIAEKYKEKMKEIKDESYNFRFFSSKTSSITFKNIYLYIYNNIEDILKKELIYIQIEWWGWS